MSTTTIKTPENLTWKGLYAKYPEATVKVEGRTVKVDALKDAIEDGTLLRDVTEAAEAQGVSTYDMLRQMSRLLSSNLVNIRKRYDSPSKTKDLARCEMLREFVKNNMDSINGTKAVGEKAKWKYTAEEIEAIPLSEVKLLKSIRDCMASKLSKYPDDIPDGFQATYGVACERYSKAAKAAKAAGPVIELDDSTVAIIDKLKNGANMSKKDKAALAAILEQLTK